MKLPYEEFVNRLYERGSQVRIVTAQGVHASLQENFRSSWRNWKGGLLTRCGHQLRCPNPTYTRLFLLFFLPNHPPAPFYFLYFSRHFVFLIFFSSFSSPSRPTNINIKHLFIAPRKIFYLYHLCVYDTFCTSIFSLLSFRSNCHVN